MRRLLHLLMASMTAVLLSVAIVAAPTIAEEAATEEATEADDHAEDEADDHAEDEGDDHADDEETGFGTGDFDGTLLAAVVGIALGLVIFGMAKPGEIEKADAHH